MARKETRIQMDGMCRVPSSRPVKDGMASESLNMVSDMGECVPVLPPELVRGDDIPTPWVKVGWEMVFVHVQPTYENHVFKVDNGDGTARVGVLSGENFEAFLTMGEGETLNGIVGVGNTLVVSTSEATHYVLWKEGGYRDLGTELPKPAVQFVGGERERRNVFRKNEEKSALSDKIWLAMPTITDSEQDRYGTVPECCDHGFFFCGSDGKYSYDEDKPDETKDARIQAIWNAYADAVAQASKFNELDDVNGRAFYQPYLFRYALRLYDGTYAMQSVPILVGGGVTWPQFLGDVHLDDSYGKGHGNDNGHYGFAMVMMYSVRAVMEEEISEDWGDIVTAVDIFCSSPINMYDPGDGSISSLDRSVYVTDLQDYFDNSVGGDHLMSPIDDNRCILVELYGLSSDQMESVMLNHNVFYRIGSFLIDNSGFSLDDYDPAREFTANQEDLVAGVQLKKPDADTLVTHTSTASTDWDDYEADHTLHGNAQRVMNQRLAIWDIDKTLGGGLPVLNGQSTLQLVTDGTDDSGWTLFAPASPGSHVYRLCWVINDNGAERFVWGGSSYWSNRFSETDRGRLLAPFMDMATQDPKDALGFMYGESVICAPFAWLAYPDAKCRRVILQRRGIKDIREETAQIVPEEEWGDVMSIPMKEHPFLNCAYAWLGFAQVLEGAEATAEDAQRFRDYYEDRLVRDVNTVMLSGAANPFTFPAAGRYTFDYAVVSCATANMPLSTGQFGQFPLYVFTKGGIWAMSMNADGTFASSSPFSRDVAVSHKGVCEIDQGIVFIADKAVLAIQGGQITDISQLMTGRHDPIPDSAVSVLENCGYGAGDDYGVTTPMSALEGAWTDGTPFMDFMADATAGYDYLGDRMIFINGEFSWQWVWMRKTATWHRTMLYEGDWPGKAAGAGVIGIISLVNSWPGLIANLAGTDRGLCAVGEMTSQLDRTRDSSLSSTGLYVSRPLTLDGPDVFKSIMDLRIRGDLKRGNAKHLLLSSNNGHDWVLRRSLRGPSFKFHRIAVVTKMTTNERLSYIEMEYDERFTNRLR